MARIRTVKPEFWIDEKVVELSPWARLLFIAAWNFADDQGYLDDKPRRIKLQVFPGDDVDIDALIAELVTAGLLDRYDSPVGPVLHVRNWGKHQRVDRAATARFDESSRVLREPSRNLASVPPHVESPPVVLATDLEGNGSGMEGKGVPPTAGANAPRADERASTELALVGDMLLGDNQPKGVTTLGGPGEVGPRTAQKLVSEWIDHCAKKPPQRVVGHVARQLGEMLAEGIDPDDVRRGLAAWHAKGLNPSVLPSVVNEVMNASTRASPVRQATSELRMAQARQAGEAVEAMLEGRAG